MFNITQKDYKHFGVEREELFYKIGNEMVRSDEKPYFPPTSEGQFDYMVYLTLLSNSNWTNMFLTNIQMLAVSMGYKPNPRVGKINDKISKSLDRLQCKYGLLEYEEKNKMIFGEVTILEVEKRFFKLKARSIQKIFNNELIKLSKDDYFNKYNDKEKAIYVYSYIVSMMGNHKTTEGNIDFYGCYPPFKQICEDCNISEDYLMKLLAYFEYDDILYTTNLGQIKAPTGISQNSSNYYTDDFNHTNTSYYFARAYCDLKNYRYSKYSVQTHNLLSEITELLEFSYDKLKELDKKDSIIVFKEHLDLVIKNIVYKSEGIFPNINRKRYEDFLKGKIKKKPMFLGKGYPNVLLFFANEELSSIQLLTHIRNNIKALMYLHKIK